MSDPLATQPMLAPAAPGGRWLKVYFGTPGNTAITLVCAILISLGYAFEQARGPFPGPKFYRSIEESPQVAPLFRPQR